MDITKPPNATPLNLADMWKDPVRKMQDRYVQNKTKLSLEDVVGRGLLILSYTVTRKENRNREMADFMTLRYKFMDDGPQGIIRTSETQSARIIDVLKLTPSTEIERAGGIIAVIGSKKNTGAMNATLFFEGTVMPDE